MNHFAKALLLGAAMLGAGTAAQAQAIIDNGTIQLGVDSLGQLNIGGYPSAGGSTSVVGLRDLRTGYESTAPGCLCEGWGVADITAGVSGYANNSSGNGGLTFVSFTAAGAGTNVNSVGSMVTTVATIDLSNLEVTHVYKASSEANLYQVDVTIKNTGGTDTGTIVYRRTMDWDIEPTPFNEYSTIQGTAGATNVLAANNNGFCSSDPLAGCTEEFAGGTGDFIDLGPSDHGANFDLQFGPIKAGEILTLTIFYGAAPTEIEALNALNAVGAEIYSLGQPSTDPFGRDPANSNFIFGFKGVGGTVVPPGIPEPATWAMLIAGFGMVGFAARRRREVANVSA